MNMDSGSYISVPSPHPTHLTYLHTTARAPCAYKRNEIRRKARMLMVAVGQKWEKAFWGEPSA